MTRRDFSESSTSSTRTAISLVSLAQGLVIADSSSLTICVLRKAIPPARSSTGCLIQIDLSRRVGRFGTAPPLYGLVWPVRRDKREALGILKPTCLGFVTVDSHVPHAFSSDEHVPLGAMLANALYPILDLYIALDGVIALQNEAAHDRPI